MSKIFSFRKIQYWKWRFSCVRAHQCLGWSVAKVGSAPSTEYLSYTDKEIKIKSFFWLGGGGSYHQRCSVAALEFLSCGLSRILCLGFVASARVFFSRTLGRQQFHFKLGALGLQSPSLPRWWVCLFRGAWSSSAQLAGNLSKQYLNAST